MGKGMGHGVCLKGKDRLERVNAVQAAKNVVRITDPIEADVAASRTTMVDDETWPGTGGGRKERGRVASDRKDPGDRSCVRRHYKSILLLAMRRRQRRHSPLLDVGPLVSTKGDQPRG